MEEAEKKEEKKPEAPKSLFGSASVPDANLFAKPAAGSLFGAKSDASPSLFGAKPASGSLFGNIPSPTPLFGSTTTKSEAKPLFGGATADKPFGDSTDKPKPALFGGAGVGE